MKARAAVLTLAMCLVGVAVCVAADAFSGTWKLNEAKSKTGPGVPKNTTVVYEAAGDSVKITVEGTDADGKATHSEWTGKFDGKDYRVEGADYILTNAYTLLDEHLVEPVTHLSEPAVRRRGVEAEHAGMIH